MKEIKYLYGLMLLLIVGIIAVAIPMSASYPLPEEVVHIDTENAEQYDVDISHGPSPVPHRETVRVTIPGNDRSHRVFERLTLILRLNPEKVELSTDLAVQEHEGMLRGSIHVHRPRLKDCRFNVVYRDEEDYSMIEYRIHLSDFLEQ